MSWQEEAFNKTRDDEGYLGCIIGGGRMGWSKMLKCEEDSECSWHIVVEEGEEVVLSYTSTYYRPASLA